ncbi:T9SS type B sorting domain-containing protein [uncultured Aquimarina sp.]|uniref:T9SS type B sorting domain-containing protein n=1 Tax=uncultured Aquimarina sp. TaxID=575652 RepID=UPI00263812A3|nr:T9SS type B sorting domain-containing protein [uncultured Aquimarina sp.]
MISTIMIRKLFSHCVALLLFTFSYSQTVTFQTDDGLTAKTICKGTEIQLNLSIDPPRPSGGTSTYNIQWEKSTNQTFIKNCQFPSTDGSCSFHRDIPEVTTTYTVTVNGGSSGPVSESIVITVEDLSNPGLDTTMFLCGRTGIINLFDELDGAPDPGGIWSNGTGTYDTADPNGGAFTYTISNGGVCPEVSAVITVKPCGDNDSDDDGVPDATDNDDDNDGIPDTIEDGFCTAVTTTPIFVLEEDFGFGGPTRSRYSEGLGLTYNPLLPDDRFNDGEYNVATSTYFRTAGGFDATFLSTDLIGEVDANGDVDGRYLAVNMKSGVFADRPVFVVENLPVTPGIEYDFSMSIASLNNNAGEIPANLTIEVVDQATNTAIFTQNSGDIPNGTDNWILVQSSFIPDPAVNVVAIRVINRQGTDGDGNDIGIDNIFLSTNACDFDRDGIPNSQDLDADNDGIYDIVESGNAAADGNGDGRFDGGINADGTSTTVVHNVINSDSDSNQDFLDIDADADGIIDNIEGQSTTGYIAPSGIDGDFNGVDDSYDTNGTAITPINSNTTAAPDYIDTNSDPVTGDCLDDTIEGYDNDQDGIPDTIAGGADSDGDGLDDAFDVVVLDRVTVQTNANNGGTVPTDFPNNHNPLTEERDWREEIGDVDVDPLDIMICNAVNLFDELPMGTLTTGTWSVPATGTVLTGGHLGTLDPTIAGILDGEYIYTLPVLAAGCPPIRYLIDVTIDDTCQCPDIEEPVVSATPVTTCIDATPLPSVTVTLAPGLEGRWYLADGVTPIARAQNTDTFTPLRTELVVGDNIFRVEAYEPVGMCTSDLVDVIITVTAPPEAGEPNDMPPVPVALCEGDTTMIDLFEELTGEDVGGVWTDATNTVIPGGTISANANIAGDYTYTVTSNGCTDTAVINVTISTVPRLVFGATSCATDRATYDVSYTTNGTWNISVAPNSEGIVDVANSMITGITAGVDITITATNPGNTACEATLAVTAPDCSCPDIVEPTNPSNESICVGSVAPLLSVDVLPGQTANWYDENGNPLITNSTTFTPTDTAAGNYVYNVEAFDTAENCASDRIEVLYQILDVPVIDPIDPVAACESYELPALAIGNYFTQTNGAGTQFNAGDIIDVSQVIYVYAETATTPNCFDEEVLNITINPLPTPVAPVNSGDRFCESYTLPALQSGQNYYTATNGEGTQLNSGDVIRTSQTIFLREVDGNGCENEVPFFVEITNIEELEIETGTICLGPITITSFVIDTELNNADFSFQWSFEGTVIPGATQSQYEATQAGVYTVSYTDVVSMCSGNSDVTITGINDPESLDLQLSAGAFSDNSDIIATIVGNGTYEYILDNGSPQDSNVFTNVSLGLHEVTAIDVTGCGSITASIFVVGFPTFFTPNNDGFNDQWGVVGNADTPEMDIYIFDRYGKLLQQLNRDNQWDGTYGGKPLPATDYWFVAEFRDGSATYRRHFTLKR